MYKLALAFVSMIFLSATPASAAAGTPSDNWVVTQLSGDARVVHPGAQAASLRVNNRLAPGDTLLTGPNGRATLVHGNDYIIVAPHSEMKLPSTPQPSGFTRVIQNLGTLLFKVQHTGIPHFAVDTPMLAAVVKGTTFTVVVDQHRSAVQVIQGIVQVNAINGGMMRMVEGGRTVFVNHDHPKMLLDADKALPATSPTSTGVTVSAAGESPLTTIASLTGGLVRADLSSPQPATAAIPVVQAALTSTSPAQSPTPTGSPSTSSPGTATTTPSTTVVVASNTATAPGATTPAVTGPAVTVGGSTVPGGTVGIAGVPAITVGSATVPSVAVGSVTTPAVTVPSLTVGSVTTPTVTVPSVTVGGVTAPTATVPSVTVGSAATPVVTVPSVTIGSVTMPPVSVPAVTTPTVAVPAVTTPTVTVPAITIGSNSGPGSMNSGPGSMNSGGSGGGLLSGLLTTVGNTVGSITGGLTHH